VCPNLLSTHKKSSTGILTKPSKACKCTQRDQYEYRETLIMNAQNMDGLAVQAKSSEQWALRRTTREQSNLQVRKWMKFAEHINTGYRITLWNFLVVALFLCIALSARRMHAQTGTFYVTVTSSTAGSATGTYSLTMGGVSSTANGSIGTQIPVGQTLSLSVGQNSYFDRNGQDGIVACYAGNTNIYNGEIGKSSPGGNLIAPPFNWTPSYAGIYYVNCTYADSAYSVTATTGNVIVAYGVPVEAQTATPTFSPAAGTYTTQQAVTLSDTTANSTIYYTTNGTTPTTSSLHCTSPCPAITVSSSETIKAFAISSITTTSYTASAAYTLNLLKPTLSVTSSLNSPITSGQSVTFTATLSNGGMTTPGVTFYDGSTVLCSAAAISAGISTCTTSTLVAGTINSITANWPGNATYSPVTSSAIILAVEPTISSSSFRVEVSPPDTSLSVTSTGSIGASILPTISSASLISLDVSISSNSDISVQNGTAACYANGVNIVNIGSGQIGQNSPLCQTNETNCRDIPFTWTPAYSGTYYLYCTYAGGVNATTQYVALTIGTAIAPPTISPMPVAGTTYTTWQTTTITAPAGKTIYYAFNASATPSSTLCTNPCPVTVKSSGTLDAIATTANSISPQAYATYTILLPKPTLSVQSSSSTITYGQTATFTATISSGVTGTISFYDGITLVCSGTISGGTASCTLTVGTLQAGANEAITAAWPGNANYGGVTSSPVSLTVNKATPTLTVTTSNPATTYGQLITFTATISASGPGQSVTFYDGSTSICSGAITSGKATCPISTLTAGSSQSITAQYAGDTNYNAVTSSAITQNVNKASPTLTLVSSVNPSFYGGSVTFTATISISGATGTVTFYDNGASIGTSSILSGSTTTTFTTSSLPLNTNSIYAIYAATTNFNAATSNTIAQVVNVDTPTLTVTSSVNPSQYGMTLIFTAAISNNAQGTITFKSGTTTLTTAPIIGSTATFSTNSLIPGSYSITANYAANTNYHAVTSNPITQVVNKATPIVTWTPAPMLSNTALTAAQLNATASNSASGAAVIGTFTYTPALGTAENIPGSSALTATFAPSSSIAPGTS